MAVAAIGGCSGSRGATRSPTADRSSTDRRTPPPKGTALESPSLAVSVAPTSGPPGTVVRLRATGCNDPSGRGHAVSFNNDAENVTGRFDANRVRSVADHQDGQTLTATYTVQASDYTGGTGLFFVQCAATVKTAAFGVTPPR